MSEWLTLARSPVEMSLIKICSHPLPNLPLLNPVTHRSDLPRHITSRHQILLQCEGIFPAGYGIVPEVEGDGVDTDEDFVRFGGRDRRRD